MSFLVHIEKVMQRITSSGIDDQGVAASAEVRAWFRPRTHFSLARTERYRGEISALCRNTGPERLLCGRRVATRPSVWSCLGIRRQVGDTQPGGKLGHAGDATSAQQIESRWIDAHR